MGKLISLLLLATSAICQVSSPHTYEDRFGTTSGSLTSPRKSESTRQSFTFVQNDGSFTIANGKLVAATQTTPGETDLYYRITSSFTRTCGLSFLFSYTPTTIGSGTGTDAGTVIGFSEGNFSFTNTHDYAVGFDNSGIQIKPEYGGTAQLQTFMSISQDTTYHVAVVLGGYTHGSGDYITATPYYAGQTASNFLTGVSIFVRVNNGDWYLRYKSTLNNITPMTPVIGQYDGTGNLDNFIVPEDDLVSILEPANYLSAIGTNGTALTAYTPQQGSAWTTDFGGFIIGSNYFVGDGSADAKFGYQALKDFGTTDMYAEMVVDSDGGQFPRMVMRYDPADSTALEVIVRGDTDVMELFTVDFGAGTNASLGSASVGSVPATDWILRVSCIGDEVRAWVAGGTTYNSLAVTTTFNNTNTYWGFGTNATTVPDFKLIRFYNAGKEGQYNIFDQLMSISFAQHRGAQ